ncbi:MAG: di-heme oxidoredictase family protein [Pirellulaceae bacterium]
MSIQQACSVLLVTAVAGWLMVVATATADDTPNREAVLVAGKILFQRHWEPGKPATRDGDGLGPMFNAVSCDACHSQGGVGGGGSIDFNVDLLSHADRSGHGQSATREKVKSTHPAFVNDKDQSVLSNITLHRFSSSPKYSALRQLLTGAPVPAGLLPKEREVLQRKFAQKPVRTGVSTSEVNFTLTQRQTPALFGAGLIDAIPDELLQKLAVAQALKFPDISGRIPQVRIEKVGRFGWRGQTEHLSDFVLGACANELGLQVPTVNQPMDPTRPDYRPVGLDLTQQQCDSITAFVASLPAPKFAAPDESEKARVAEFGRTVFRNIGCAACHVETVGPATQIYSDLLLHDMGPALADPVAAEHAFLQIERVPVSFSRGQSQESEPNVPQQRGYSGGSGPPPIQLVHIHQPFTATTAIRTTFKHVPTTITQEWRTPPLWGVAHSAPYLHDGRAATLLEAIALHGGEAKATTARFLELPTTERLALLEFLSCLQVATEPGSHLPAP